MHKKSLLIFVVCTMVLIASNQVMANDAEPAPSIDLGPCKVDIVLDVNGDYPVKYTNGGQWVSPWYLFEMKVEGCDVNKLDHIYAAIEARYGSPIDLNLPAMGGGVQYLEPCEGGGNVSFAEGVCTVRVAKVDLQGNKLIIVADTKLLGGVSLSASAGNKDYFGLQPIWGPGYYDLSAVQRPGTAFDACIPLEDYNPDTKSPLAIKVKRNPFSLCPDDEGDYGVFEHHTLDCSDTPGTRISPEETGNLPKKAFSDTGNQFCEGAIWEEEFSPSCFTYVSGGRTRYIPKDCK